MSLYKQLSDKYTEAANLLWMMDVADDMAVHNPNETGTQVLSSTMIEVWRNRLISIRAEITNLHTQIATLKN